MAVAGAPGVNGLLPHGHVGKLPNVPDHRRSDPTPDDQQVEIVVDLGPFLPETTAIGPVGPTETETDTGPDIHRADPGAEVDLAVLTGIESDLAAVDEAIEAIDAGDHARSRLLTDLLGSPG